MSLLFEADKKPLTFLLDQIQNRELALPDFQRSFVWDANATRELVVSIMQSFPAGSLLLMQGGASIFKPRAFEGAPELVHEPPFLVLDGQQRLTSLYQAFTGHGGHRYFLNIHELLDGSELDEAVQVHPVRRAEKWASADGQARDLMLPLQSLRSFAYWRDDILELRGEAGEDVKKLKTQLNDIEREYIKPVELYQFPVTTLSSRTPTEAVCTIFETLNRTGIKLSVFELLTARAFAHDVRLREMWRQAREQYGILEDFDVDPYYILQVIALAVRRTPKRSAVLKLEVDEIVEHWGEAVGGMAGVLDMLRSQCGVLVPKWLPYQTALITMAAAWPQVEAVTGPTVGSRRSKLQRYFWSSAFMGAYDNAANTQSETDLPGILRWFDGGDPPEAVSRFSFNPDRWRFISPRQRALYKATMALLMRDQPRDFHKGVPLTKEVIEVNAVDDHHIFPRKFLQEHGLSGMVDTVLNHTLIDKRTNIRIGGRAPSKYLGEMRAELGDGLLRAILDSHSLPSQGDGALLRDDYEAFLEWRVTRLRDQLRGALGEDFAVSPEEAEGPETAPAAADVEIVDEREVIELLDEAGLGEEEVEAGTQLPVLAREVVEVVNARARNIEDAVALEDFLRQIVSWEGTVAELGRSVKTPDGLTGYVMVRRLPRKKGVFIYVSPKGMAATMRLKERDVDVSTSSYARRRDVKDRNQYQIRVDLESGEGRAESVRLARLAYEKAS
jgi:hypothetical protein